MSKTRRVFLAVAMLQVAALTAPGTITQSAGGSGTITAGGAKRTFAFTVVKDSFGNARGAGELVRHDTGNRIHLKINCLNISGNVATVSGTSGDVSSNAVQNLPFWFRVADNGEGAGSPPDEISLVFSFLVGSVSCNGDLGPPMFPIEDGNIQVKP